MIDADWVVITTPSDRACLPSEQLGQEVSYLRSRYPEVVFRVAVLGGTSLTICDALDEAEAAGASSLVVVDAQTLPDKSTTAWFRRVIGHWLRTRKPTRLDVRLARPISTGGGFGRLIEDALSEPTVRATDRTAPLLSPLWQQVPGFTHHVLVCRGPRCSALGAAESAVALSTELERYQLDDNDVLVTMTGCLFPCAQAPVMAVYPDDTWYAQMSPDRVAGMVEQHLVGGAVVTDWLGARRG